MRLYGDVTRDEVDLDRSVNREKETSSSSGRLHKLSEGGR